jgi:hypothetical protein
VIDYPRQITKEAEDVGQFYVCSAVADVYVNACDEGEVSTFEVEVDIYHTECLVLKQAQNRGYTLKARQCGSGAGSSRIESLGKH